MIRDAFVGIWLCAATVAALMFAQSQLPDQSGGSGQAKGAPMPLQYRPIVPSGMMSVSDIRDGRIQGYFLSRFLFVMDPKQKTRTDVPQKLLFSDAYASLLSETDLHELFHGHGLKIDHIQDRMKELINTGVGFPLVHAVLAQQLDYLAHAGAQQSRSRKGLLQGG